MCVTGGRAVCGKLCLSAQEYPATVIPLAAGCGSFELGQWGHPLLTGGECSPSHISAVAPRVPYIHTSVCTSVGVLCVLPSVSPVCAPV